MLCHAREMNLPGFEYHSHAGGQGPPSGCTDWLLLSSRCSSGVVRFSATERVSTT